MLDLYLMTLRGWTQLSENLKKMSINAYLSIWEKFYERYGALSRKRLPNIMFNSFNNEIAHLSHT